MPTRNFVLTEHHQAIIDALVASGRYESASEVLREGLDLLEQREQLECGKRNALSAAARVGFGDLEAGRYRDLADHELDSFLSDLGRRATQGTGGSAE